MCDENARPDVERGVTSFAASLVRDVLVHFSEYDSALTGVFSQRDFKMVAQQDVYTRPISEIMNRDVVTINAAGTVHEALILMEENRVSTLPVVDNKDHCVGILSTSDLVAMTRDVDEDVYELDHADVASQRFLIEKLIHSMGSESIQSFMSETVATVDSNATVIDATRRMLKDQIHHLPIVDPQGRLVGIVSTMDILGEFADAAPV